MSLRCVEPPVNNPWIAVIIPSHDRPRWLSATLQSLVDQHEPGLEVIFVDSSVNDANLHIAESFSDALDLRVFRRPDIVSWMAKTNFGVEQARAERICMLHTDDLWLPDRCARLRTWLSRSPDAAMHLHPCYFIDETDKRLGIWRTPFVAGDAPVPRQEFYRNLLVQNFIGIPTPAIRRSDYLAAGGLDESLWYTADWDLYLKLAERGAVLYHPDVVACFRVHKGSLTVLGSRDLPDFRAQHQAIIDRHLNKLDPAARDRVSRLFRVSVDVNAALAAAMGGKYAAILPTAFSVLALGPHDMAQFFASSRIADRVAPRLRALLSRKL
jgi:glycosyltransferase involved in cell wall biosynthesis